MTIALLELACDVLGDVAQDVIFVGGATLELLTTDPLAPPPRPTEDVDIVFEAVSRAEYERLADRLRARGMTEDSGSRVICRWRVPDSPIVLDVMPTSARVFGFANRWYPEVARSAVAYVLPSGRRVRVIVAPLLLATKFEAYSDRGRDNYLESRDFADIVMILDGRPSVVEEVEKAPEGVRSYLAARAKELLLRSDIALMVSVHLRPDDASQDRAEAVVLPALRSLARLRVDSTPRHRP